MLHAPDRVTKGVELGMRGGRVRGGVEGRSERFREALAVRVVDTRCEPRAGIIAQPRGFPDVVDAVKLGLWLASAGPDDQQRPGFEIQKDGSLTIR